MKAIFWISAAVAGVFALLLGMYAHYWLDDAWPENVLFFGYRLSTLLLLAGGLALSGLTTYGALLAIARRRATRHPAG